MAGHVVAPDDWEGKRAPKRSAPRRRTFAGVK